MSKREYLITYFLSNSKDTMYNDDFLSIISVKRKMKSRVFVANVLGVEE